jgi:hypothetical protein
MANVLNRTTKEYLLSVNTPDYPETEWLINPAIPEGVDINSRNTFTVSGDAIVANSKLEKDVLDAADEAVRTTRVHAVYDEILAASKGAEDLAPITATTEDRLRVLERAVFGK